MLQPSIAGVLRSRSDCSASVYTSDPQMPSEVTFDPSTTTKLSNDIFCRATATAVDEADIGESNV